MSIRVPCPTCGPRAMEEFVHGEILDPPPEVVGRGDDAVDVDRGYMHTNAGGVVTEAWFHLYGCRRWITLQRDTVRDEFVDP